MDLVKLIVTFKSQMKQKDARQGMKFGALKLRTSSFLVMFNFSTLPAFWLKAKIDIQSQLKQKWCDIEYEFSA